MAQAPTTAEAREKRQPPAAPTSNVELLLGYLDLILAALQELHATLESPGGSGTVGDAGSVSGPAAGATIVSVPAPGGGRFRIAAKTFKSGAGVGGLVNGRLFVGGGQFSELLTLTTLEEHVFPDVLLRQGEEVTVRVVTADGGVDYAAFLTLTRIA